jgi:hypothetical protein
MSTTRPQHDVGVSEPNGLHPKLWTRGRFADATVPPIVRGTIIRVQVSRLPKPAGRLKVLWLWWAGPGAPDLDLVWRAYVRRFDIEHTLRFCKQTLGWVTPRVRHPEQADRWTWLLLAAATQLRLARPLVADQRLPWERRLDPRRLTPTRVRRGFANFTRPYRCSPARRNPAGQAQVGPRLLSQPSSPPSCHQEERRTGHSKPTGRLRRKLRGVGYARLSSSTGMVRTPAVWRAYSAKPG